MADTNIPSFETKEEALSWLRDEIDDPCMDNFRFAFDDEPQGEYMDAQYHGCCGSADRQVIVAGRSAQVGCNYGH
jgi:hypothetical protein